MCARYYIDRSIYGETSFLADETADMEMKTGDIRPSDMAPALVSSSGGIKLCGLEWGYPGYGGKRLLINARAETVMEKKTFRNGIASHRCVLPARWFYEWDADKNKVAFLLPDKEMLCLAGCYDLFGGKERFAVLTTEAEGDARNVHDRMPLIIPKDRIWDWLLTDRYKDMLSAHAPLFEQEREYEQLALW